MECSEDERAKYQVAEGDFFFVRSSLKLEGIGKAASVLSLDEEIVFECHIVRGRPNNDVIEQRFLSYLLNSSFARAWFISAANTVTMATMDQAKVKALPVALPPYLEQELISSQLESRLLKLEQVSERVALVVGMLEEYRSALITNAVTGQIKVA